GHGEWPSFAPPGAACHVKWCLDLWRRAEMADLRRHHPPLVADAGSDAGAVEELQHLDRDLPPGAEPVAEARRGHGRLAALAQLGDEMCHLGRGGTQEEVVRRDLHHAAELGG